MSASDEDPKSAHQWHLYVGAIDDLQSLDSYPKAVRHVVLRANFVSLMLNDTRIIRAARRAPRAKLEATVDELWDLAFSGGDPGEQLVSDAQQRFGAEFERWCGRLVRALWRILEKFDTPNLRGGVSWPWLLQDLSISFGKQYLVEALTEDGQGTQEHQPGLVYRVEAPRLPPFTVEPLPGESTASAIARSIRETKERGSKSRTMARRPIKKLARLEQYAEWFYRYHLLGEQIAALAADYHETEPGHPGRLAGRKPGRTETGGCDDRATITYGIGQAERFLRDFPTHRRES